MRLAFMFALLASLLTSVSTAYAGGIDSFSFDSYGVTGTLPPRFTPKVFEKKDSAARTYYKMYMFDNFGDTSVAGVFISPRTGFRDVRDWIERHEIGDVLFWLFDKHHYSYQPLSAPKGALQLATLGSGQKVTVWQQRLDISVPDPDGFEVRHVMRNIAFLYGMTDKAWYYVFLGNAKNGAQDLDEDIQTIAAAIQIK